MAMVPLAVALTPKAACPLAVPTNWNQVETVSPGRVWAAASLRYIQPVAVPPCWRRPSVPSWAAAGGVDQFSGPFVIVYGWAATFSKSSSRPLVLAVTVNGFEVAPPRGPEPATRV